MKRVRAESRNDVQLEPKGYRSELERKPKWYNHERDTQWSLLGFSRSELLGTKAGQRVPLSDASNRCLQRVPQKGIQFPKGNPAGTQNGNKPNNNDELSTSLVELSIK